MDKPTITCRSPGDCIIETPQAFTELTVNGQSLSRSTQCGAFVWPGHDDTFEYNCANWFQGSRKLWLSSDCRNPVAFFRPVTSAQRIITEFMKGRPNAEGEQREYNHLQLAEILTDAGFYAEATTVMDKISDKGLKAGALAFMALRRNQPALFEQSLVLAKADPDLIAKQWTIAAIAGYMAQAGLWERAIEVVASQSSVIPGDGEWSPQGRAAGEVAEVAAQKQETHRHITTVMGRLQNPEDKTLVSKFAILNMSRHGFLEEAWVAMKEYPDSLNTYDLDDLARIFADKKLYERALLIANMRKDPIQKIETQVVVEARAGTVAAAVALVENVPAEKRDRVRQRSLVSELSRAGHWEAAVAQTGKLSNQSHRDHSYDDIVGDMIRADQAAKGIPVAMRIQDLRRADQALLEIAESAAKEGGKLVAQLATDKIEDPEKKAEAQKFVAQAAKFVPKRPIPIDEAALEKDPSWVGLMLYCN